MAVQQSDGQLELLQGFRAQGDVANAHLPCLLAAVQCQVWRCPGQVQVPADDGVRLEIVQHTLHQRVPQVHGLEHAVNEAVHSVHVACVSLVFHSPNSQQALKSVYGEERGRRQRKVEVVCPDS